MFWDLMHFVSIEHIQILFTIMAEIMHHGTEKKVAGRIHKIDEHIENFQNDQKSAKLGKWARAKEIIQSVIYA